MTSLVSEQQSYIPIPVPGVGDVIPAVFRELDYIAENWIAGSRGLEQYKKERFGLPAGFSSLLPSEVAHVWHTLETKRNNGKYIGLVSKKSGLTETEARKTLHNFWQKFRDYAIRSQAFGLIQDRKDLVYGNSFDPNSLPAVIQGASIQTPNQEYAKDLDKIIRERIEKSTDPTLDDLVKVKAKFVGGEFYPLPQLLRNSSFDALKEEFPFFLGVTKSNFPSGVSYIIVTDPQYGNGYRSVDWVLDPADEESPTLELFNPLEGWDSFRGSLQGRRSADSDAFYRSQVIQLEFKVKSVKDELMRAQKGLLSAAENL